MSEKDYVNDDQLNEVSGGIDGLDAILMTIGGLATIRLINYLRSKYPDAETAIMAIRDDLTALSPEIQELVKKIGHSKTAELIRSKWGE